MKKLSISHSITPHDSRSLKLYLSDIAKYPLLSAEEEVELAQRIHLGDQSARDKMILSNLRFVVSVAKQYQQANLELCDLISVGNIGLIKAVERFDETRGFKFSSYAVWYINQAVMDYVNGQARAIRLPANKIALLSHLRRLSSELEQKLNRRPTTAELARELGVEESRITSLLSCDGNVSSLNAPTSDDGDGELIDVIEDDGAPRPDNALMKESLSTVVGDVLKMFGETDRNIISMLFGIGRDHASSLSEVAAHLGLTSECVRQRLSKCLIRIRKSDQCAVLAAYL